MVHNRRNLKGGSFMKRCLIITCTMFSGLAYVSIQAQGFELGDEPTFYRRLPERADVNVYQKAYKEQLRGPRDIKVLERMQQEEEDAREKRKKAYDVYEADWLRRESESMQASPEEGRMSESWIRQTLDNISDSLHNLRERLTPRARAALESAKRSFENAWEETNKHTAHARAKMDEYINRGMESLREARAQMPSMELGVVGPEAGRDISIQLRKQEEFEPGLKMMASESAMKYRKAVKDFDSRKQWRRNSGYANLLQKIIDQFNAIKAEIQSNSELKRAVTVAVVPLLVRMWKSQDVLIEYIDGYLKKLEYELGNVNFQSQFQPQPKLLV